MEDAPLIYIVMAHRWGESTEHSYLVGWEGDLDKAKEMADKEWASRGCCKYSGVVYSVGKGLNGMGGRRQEVYRKGL